MVEWLLEMRALPAVGTIALMVLLWWVIRPSPMRGMQVSPPPSRWAPPPPDPAPVAAMQAAANEQLAYARAVQNAGNPEASRAEAWRAHLNRNAATHPNNSDASAHPDNVMLTPATMARATARFMAQYDANGDLPPIDPALVRKPHEYVFRVHGAPGEPASRSHWGIH